MMRAWRPAVPEERIAGGLRIEEVGSKCCDGAMTQHILSLPTRALASPSRVQLPDAEACWHAVQRRDRAYNGRFWFSVRTTVVYCLPSCAARPPLRKNVAFHTSPADAEAAGFRPCKRCKPTDWQADSGLSK